MKSDNEEIASIEERDLISEFYFGPGYTGIFSTRLTWNDIMPVVKKISNLDLNPCENDFGSQSEIEASNRQQSVCILEIDTPIEKVCNEVLEFIKWYNTQQK